MPTTHGNNNSNDNNNNELLDQQFLKIKEQKTAQREEDGTSIPQLPPVHKLYNASQAQQLNPFIQLCYMRSAPIDNHHDHPSASAVNRRFIPSQLDVSEFSSEQVVTKPVFIPYRKENSKKK